MLQQTQLRLHNKFVNLIKESNVFPYINKKPKTILTDSPKSLILSKPTPKTVKYLNEPKHDIASVKYNSDPLTNREITNYKDNKYNKKQYMDDGLFFTSNPMSFIMDDVAVIPAGKYDKIILEDAGLSNATYIVKDKNTGNFVGGLSLNIDDPNNKYIKFVEISPDGTRMRKVIAHMIKSDDCANIERVNMPLSFKARLTPGFDMINRMIDQDQPQNEDDNSANIVSDDTKSAIDILKEMIQSSSLYQPPS